MCRDFFRGKIAQFKVEKDLLDAREIINRIGEGEYAVFVIDHRFTLRFSSHNEANPATGKAHRIW